MPYELHHASDKFLDDSVFNLSSLVASEAHSYAPVPCLADCTRLELVCQQATSQSGSASI